jgi:hypothetical protein
MDRAARRALIAAALMFAVAFATRAAHAGSDDLRAAYNQWVADYAAKSLDGNILQITLVGEMKPAKHNPFHTKPPIYTFAVKPDGETWWQSSSDFDTKGGNGNPVPSQSLTRLKDLASKLPADAGALPSPERRLLIQTRKATHVYDRAELPDTVNELLRVSGCPVGSWWPIF